MYKFVKLNKLGFLLRLKIRSSSARSDTKTKNLPVWAVAFFLLYEGTSGNPFFFVPLVIRILFFSVGTAASGGRARLATAPAMGIVKRA